MPGLRRLALIGMAAVGMALGVSATPAAAQVYNQTDEAADAPVVLVHDHWRQRGYDRGGRGYGHGYGRRDYYPPPRHYGYDRPRYYHPPPRVYYPPPPPRYYRPPPGVYFSY